MLKMTQKNYVQIPNVAFGFGTDYKLNNDELKVFTYLQFMRNVGTMNIRTTASIIVEDLGWETTKPSRDNARAGEAVQGLSNKGYISLSFKKDVKKDPLAIEVTIEELKTKVEVQSKVDWKTNPFTFKGWTDVNTGEYNLVGEDDYKLTVMAYHNWRANAKFEYAIADKEWAEVLGLSVKHTRVIIDDCNFLTKISGEKYIDDKGQCKQETNQYVKTAKVTTKLTEIEITNKNMTFLEKERQKITDILVSHDDDVFGQIFDKTKLFEFKGYKAFKETTCDFVKKAGEKKLEVIGKSEKGAYVVKKLEEEYQQSLANNKQMEAMAKRYEASINDSNFETEEEYEARINKQAELRIANKKESKVFDFFDEY